MMLASTACGLGQNVENVQLGYIRCDLRISVVCLCYSLVFQHKDTNTQHTE